jgi:hypothetical protein
MADEKLNWNDLANTTVGDVERPPLKPIGHYVGVFSGKAETGESTKKGTLYATFPVQVNEALDDVDQEQLNEAGGPNFKGECTFWLSPKALWMITEFGKQMGASDELNVMELIEWLGDCGEPIVFQGTHEPNDRNPERPFFRLQNPVPLSAFQGVSAS